MFRQKKVFQDTKKSLGFILGLQALWILTLFLLAGWWGELLWRQAHQISDLQEKLGVAPTQALADWNKTQRMVFWESITFFSLLLATTGIFFWIYWRDLTRSRALTAFFASVTHEFKTPLTSIRLQAESLAERLKDDPIRGLVKRLLEDCFRIESQVERTLELSRVEGGGIVFQQSIEIRPFAQAIIALWLETYEEQVRVQMQLDDETILGDAACLSVVFKNILENSLRHADQYSNRPQGPLTVQITSKKQGGNLEITLQDNGRGFAGDTRKLGSLFFRGPHSKGTGVGLYLVQMLMKKMGGSSRFESQPTGFQVTLSFRLGASDGRT